MVHIDKIIPDSVKHDVLEIILVAHFCSLMWETRIYNLVTEQTC